MLIIYLNYQFIRAILFYTLEKYCDKHLMNEMISTNLKMISDFNIQGVCLNINVCTCFIYILLSCQPRVTVSYFFVYNY